MNVSMLNAYHECEYKLFKKNCHVTQCFRCHEFDHMIKFCRKDECCVKCANKHHIEKCTTSSNRRCCANCNENYKFWRRICLKWQQQMKQASEIYRSRSFRYLKALRYNCTFSQFLNSLTLMNSSNSMNSTSSTTVVLKTCNLDSQKSSWQIVKVKKRWIDCSLCASNDSKETMLKQNS